MKTAIIPKFFFESEDIITLRDKNIKFDEGNVKFGRTKVDCYRFYNLTETEVFDELDTTLLESAATDNRTYAARAASIMFLRARQVASIKDHDTKLTAAISLIAAINSLATIDMTYARRLLPLARSISP